MKFYHLKQDFPAMELVLPLDTVSQPINNPPYYGAPPLSRWLHPATTLPDFET